ncbi:hypothetical protein Ct61P_05459 [Colletotrichum tofieldiae]|nr:hypothetical protein Ct61P_05459 [Colletotrichum tofieldiae]
MADESATVRHAELNAIVPGSLLDEPEVAVWMVIRVSRGVQAHDKVPVALARPVHVVAVGVCDACATPETASASPLHFDATAELMSALNAVELAEQKQECEDFRPPSPHPDFMLPTTSASGDAAHPGRSVYPGTRSMNISWQRAARESGSTNSKRIAMVASGRWTLVQNC